MSERNGRKSRAGRIINCKPREAVFRRSTLFFFLKETPREEASWVPSIGWNNNNNEKSTPIHSNSSGYLWSGLSNQTPRHPPPPPPQQQQQQQQQKTTTKTTTIDLPCFPLSAAIFIRLKCLFSARFSVVCKSSFV